MEGYTLHEIKPISEEAKKTYKFNEIVYKESMDDTTKDKSRHNFVR
jgi:hypothetical protein